MKDARSAKVALIDADLAPIIVDATPRVGENSIAEATIEIGRALRVMTRGLLFIAFLRLDRPRPDRMGRLDGAT